MINGSPGKDSACSAVHSLHEKLSLLHSVKSKLSGSNALIHIITIQLHFVIRVRVITLTELVIVLLIFNFKYVNSFVNSTHISSNIIFKLISSTWLPLAFPKNGSHN